MILPDAVHFLWCGHLGWPGLVFKMQAKGRMFFNIGTASNGYFGVKVFLEMAYLCKVSAEGNKLPYKHA